MAGNTFIATFFGVLKMVSTKLIERFQKLNARTSREILTLENVSIWQLNPRHCVRNIFSDHSFKTC